MKKYIRFLIVFTMGLVNIKAQTYFMTLNGGVAPQDGSTWEKAMPFSNFNTTATASGFKTIHLAKGNYTLNAVAIFDNTAGLYLDGGYPANATGTDISGYDPVANATVIQATSGAYINITNSTQDKNMTFAGLSFTGNWATTNIMYVNTGPSNAPVNKILNLLLKDLHVYNITGSTGEGYFQFKGVASNTRVKVQNCLFENNNNGNSGKPFGFDNCGLVDGSITGGVKGGGPDYYAIIEDCKFVNNTGNNTGGTMYFTSNASDVLVQNNSFCGNIASRGGAVYMQGNNRIKFSGNKFKGNTAAITGSAIYLLEAGGAPQPGILIDGNTFYQNLDSTIPDIAIPRDCCNNGVTVGITNNTFDKSSTAAVVGVYGVGTPNPNTGNTYNSTTDPLPGGCTG